MELYLNHLLNREIWAASGNYKMELLDIWMSRGLMPQYEVCTIKGRKA
jgi:hypothetical protein